MFPMASEKTLENTLEACLADVSSTIETSLGVGVEEDDLFGMVDFNVTIIIVISVFI